LAEKLNSTENNPVVTITTAMFTKVLAIKMVARSFLGLPCKNCIALLEAVSSSINSSNCALDKEKNAFSEPEKIADKKINKKIVSKFSIIVAKSPAPNAGFNT
jgi:hypothetical protein